MKDFSSFELPEALTHTLAHMEFTTPTPIQAKAIPPALEGRDILGSAQTGTGKTAAFGIPLVTKLITDSRSSALVMTPTRELAVQVIDQLQKLLGRRSSIKSALLIGGEPMPKQLQLLRARPRLIVGTPGRINDHLERGSLMLFNTNFLVLDETDRMLDMGFSIQIDRVMKFLPKQRQTLLFSATLPNNIVKISEQYLNNPVRVAAGGHSKPAQNLKQEIIHVNEADKYKNLTDQLNKREGTIIVFVKTKYGTEKMARKLCDQGHSADAIHGDLRQNKRDRVLANFRNRKHRILVATDVAARGLDIPHIEHVINYDLPQCPEDYIHRIGRTARAGAEGSALCLISPADRIKWNAIEQLLNPDAKPQGNQQHSKPRRPSRGSNSSRPGSRNGSSRNGPPRGPKDGPSKGGSSKGKPARAGSETKAADANGTKKPRKGHWNKKPGPSSQFKRKNTGGRGKPGAARQGAAS